MSVEPAPLAWMVRAGLESTIAVSTGTGAEFAVTAMLFVTGADVSAPVSVAVRVTVYVPAAA